MFGAWTAILGVVVVSEPIELTIPEPRFAPKKVSSTIKVSGQRVEHRLGVLAAIVDSSEDVILSKS